MDLQKAILQNIWWTHAWHARDRLEGGTGHLLFLVWGIACGAVFTLWKLMATHPCDQCAFLYVLIYSIPIKSFFKENKWHTLGAHSAGDRTSPEDVSLLKKIGILWDSWILPFLGWARFLSVRTEHHPKPSSLSSGSLLHSHSWPPCLHSWASTAHSPHIWWGL